MNDSIILPLVDTVSFPHRAPIIETKSLLLTEAHVTIFMTAGRVLLLEHAVICLREYFPDTEKEISYE